MYTVKFDRFSKERKKKDRLTDKDMNKGKIVIGDHVD